MSREVELLLELLELTGQDEVGGFVKGVKDGGTLKMVMRAEIEKGELKKIQLGTSFFISEKTKKEK